MIRVCVKWLAWRGAFSTRVRVGLTGVLLLVAAGLGPARAEIAGQADFVHGQVTAARGAEAARPLSKGAEIHDQDDIRTAAGARAQLRFTDGGIVSLMPETRFSVQEYRLGDGGGARGSLVFGLLSGGLRTVTGAIGKQRHEAYELKTPVGSLGIRGTEFTAVLDTPNTLRVHVGRGRVVLSNDWGVQDVGEGQSGLMSLSQAPVLVGAGDAPASGLQPGGNGAPGLSPNQDIAPQLELPLVLPPGVSGRSGGGAAGGGGANNGTGGTNMGI